MKKVKILLSAALLIFMTVGLNAQSLSGSDFYAGKWSILVKGTPSGDSKMIFNLNVDDGKLTGVITDTTGVEITKIDNSVLENDVLTLYFNTSGYDIHLVLSKKDDDHVTGTLFNMFEAEGVRIKD